jgi:hypothetical protein
LLLPVSLHFVSLALLPAYPCFCACVHTSLGISNSEGYYRRGCDALSSGRSLPPFRSNILLPSLGSKSKPNKEQTSSTVPAACLVSGRSWVPFPMRSLNFIQ